MSGNHLIAALSTRPQAGSRTSAVIQNSFAIASGTPPATGDVKAVIRALVQAHIMFGSTYVLEQVAATLEFEGRSDIATVIRQMLGEDGNLVHVED